MPIETTKWLRDMVVEERTGISPYEGGRWYHATAEYSTVGVPANAIVGAVIGAAVEELCRNIAAVFFGLHGLLLGDDAKGWKLIVLKGEWVRNTLLAETGTGYVDATFSFVRE